MKKIVDAWKNIVLCGVKQLKTPIMSIIIFFLVVIVFSLVLNAVDKIRSFKQEHKSLWEDGDSVCVRKGSVDPEVREHNFMTRLS